MKCPKCDGEMDRGLLVDASPGGAKPGTWIKGDELPMIRLHLLPPRFEISGERYLLEAQRCQQCGFLEWYANQHAPSSL